MFVSKSQETDNQDDQVRAWWHLIIHDYDNYKMFVVVISHFWRAFEGRASIGFGVAVAGVAAGVGGTLGGLGVSANERVGLIAPRPCNRRIVCVCGASR